MASLGRVEAEHQASQEQLAEILKQKKALEDELTAAESLTQTAKASLAEEQKVHQATKRKLAEASKCEQDLLGTKQKLAAVKEANVKKKLDAAALVKEHNASQEKVNAQLEDLEKHHAALKEEHVSTLDIMTKTRDEMKATQKQYHEMREKLEAEIKNLRQEEARRDALLKDQKNVASTKTELENWHSTRAKAQENLNDLVDAYDKTKAELKATELSLKGAKEAEAKFEKGIAEAKAALAQHKGSVRSIDDELAKVKAQLDAVNRQKDEIEENSYQVSNLLEKVKGLAKDS